MTWQQVEEHNVRLFKNRFKDDAVQIEAIPEGTEKNLHCKIECELKRRRWLFIHSRTDMKTTTAKGVPDFTVFPADGFRSFFMEIKTAKGKLTQEQRVWQYCCEILGHSFFVVRSFTEALIIMDEFTKK